ncbi:hypothetical protein FRACYDRAFT_240984 [Fragilariopsis cylindrus CCMP1102]|uniref:Uncharacterized protein n=1 Tax=Fragilariopsis cylindrus CCMP1102 TaxID=635003 RepID=A0A1E7F8E2_9STRA|nr:hypothetical protein FRACYDRAFT_240984 [Fragilariopsis cylindrus CCMP1102]|eukprot:OEU14442.1 hypothetical protein FRACYDRAFT_240984 [Fragilariopsis cylindrus CCMP1102]
MFIKLRTNDFKHGRNTAVPAVTIVVIPESIWRTAAINHRKQIQKLLQPGLVNNDHPLMAAIISQRNRQQQEKIRQRQQQQKQQKLNNKDENDEDNDENDDTPEDQDDEGMMNNMTVLDPKHPVYNFLVEYYGLKGLKGPKRLARWSPSISLLLFNVRTLENIDDEGDEDNADTTNDDDTTTSTSTSKTTKMKIKTITSIQELNDASSFAFISNNGNDIDNDCILGKENDGIFLEGATPDDFAVILHLKGAEWIDDANEDTDNINDVIAGTLETVISSSSNTNHNHNYNNHNKIASYIWYKSILETTIQSEPILHCYGLHEWAMQYHPFGAEKPPSGKYQQHLPLRVSREIINTTVERKGLRCTHVDALRFFAPAAAPLNHHGSFLEREDQLRLEQSGCVHSHMDLLKIALKLIPYCDSQLLVDIVDIALEARTLDVGASPYDCSQYKYEDGQDIVMIPVETTEGRKQYKELQTKLMYKTESIRKRLLINYNLFLKLCFTPDEVNIAIQTPNINEQYAYTKPGGLPWRKSLIDDKINK